MIYSVEDIATIIGTRCMLRHSSLVIEHLLTDSRKLIFASSTLFFALKSSRRNGEDFISELYHSGCRSFVATLDFDASPFPEANFIFTPNVLLALQQLTAYHRRQFNITVIGITGSNGKTIVKEWLYQLLNTDYRIVRSPKSYNSQIGVPLSVWQMNESHNLAIFEAGISEPGEMGALEDIIRPNIGVLTNIRIAHAAGFTSREEKLDEKWLLFKDATKIITNNLNPSIRTVVEAEPRQKTFIWGDHTADVYVTNIDKQQDITVISAVFKGRPIDVTIPFNDNASIENAVTVWTILLYLGIDEQLIRSRMLQLQQVEMRLQLMKGINNTYVINDSYSNDLSSLRIALAFLQQQANNLNTTVILSDLGEIASTEEQYRKVLIALVQHKVNRFIGIGPRLKSLEEVFRKELPLCYFYNSVDDFIRHFINIRFRDEVILLKGARAFEFEEINLLLEQQAHQTVLEVNLTAMAHNLKQYQQHLKPETKVMAMVKAFSYGSGSAEVASVLQFHKVDYLAVAYADEGVELRKSGIAMPILVMNPESVTFQLMVNHNLEPEIYSFGLLNAFTSYLSREGLQQFPIHIKIDTGMHRLGFDPGDVTRLCEMLAGNTSVVVKSVFSHLVGSEDAVHDAFTELQTGIFLTACHQLQQALQYSFIRHISNSAAIFRHPSLQFDMVRLGIGLYGVDSSARGKLSLQTVATLRSTIAQIRHVKSGETIGYSRKGILFRDSLIATIRIGYADGFNRRLSNGVGHVFVKGQLAPVVGSVCMDMTMIDITAIEGVQEGDSVEIFGSFLPVQQVAQWAGTIPYEIMTSVSHRVKREYYEE